MKNKPRRHRVKDPLLMHNPAGVRYTCAACNAKDHKFCSRYQGKAKIPCTCDNESH